ncbi:hypothetical protein GOP47_0013262 [Adiantum capillus-veneris]|uniref:Uncharacterized protein n=1 Tax=Adiantum capillus-veneris TaxID=13818 RepID=A0A9D4UNV7_ADICA|nr:hypothetical protein GOP47_0013262 [Adiantum capillus-veneris]
MLRGEEDRKQSRSSAHAVDEKSHSGLGWLHMEKSPLGPSRFQVPLSQRNRPFSRKPPEPLRRAVAACLSAPYPPSSEAVGTLQDYLSNPSTVDLAYAVLLEHANAERERSPPVVARCVSLLKRYLVRYVPKHAMLQQVDTFCATLIAECSPTIKSPLGSSFSQAVGAPANSGQAGITSQVSTKADFASVSLVKSLAYVRSLVARHLPSNLLQSTRIAELSNAYTKRSRALYTAFGPPGMQGASDDKDFGKTMSLHSLEDNEEFIAGNVLRWRWIGGKRNQCWTPSPVMTDSGGISRPQVKQLFEYSDMGAGSLFMRGSDFKGQKQQGKQVEKSVNHDSIGEQLLQPSKVTTITDGVSTQSHLRAIATSKRQKSQSQVWNADVPKSTWRKRPRPLFQYKHYSEQQPLRLSNSEIEEVLSAFHIEGTVVGGITQGITPMLPVVHPGRVSIEAADVAGSVLIKLIIDMYMADPITASPLTLSMLEGMLGSSTIAARVRCFDLILNLGIHGHLLEPMQMEEQSVLGEESIEASALLASAGPFSSSKRGLNLEEAFRAEERLELMRPQESSGSFKAPVDKVDGSTPEAVKLFELWLLQILFEMLLFLVQIRETEESIWVAALSCLLYFVCDGSRIQRHRLHGLDIRVLKNLLDISWARAWADELQCTLVCMLSNMLYKIARAGDGCAGRYAEFDVEQLELLGGIEFVCLEYTRANSAEAKANLFCVILDYVLLQLNINHSSTGRSQPSADDIQAVFGALLLADGAKVLGFALKHGIRNVGEGLFETIATAMSRDIDSGRLNSQLLQEITVLLEALVVTFTQPDEEFTEHVSLTMAVEEPSSTLNYSPAELTLVSNAWATLNSLLHSSKLSCRLNGYSWLVNLLSSNIGHDTIGTLDNVLQQNILNSSWSKGLNGFNEGAGNKSGLLVALHLLYGLLRSRQAVIRRGFILVLERLLVNYQKLAVSSISMQVSEGEGTRVDREPLLAEKWQNKLLGLINGALLQFVSANDTNHVNILQMCNVMFSQLCIVLPSPSSLVNPSNTFMKDNMVFNRFGSYQNFSSKHFSTFMNSGQFDSKQSSGTTEYRGYVNNKGQRSMPVSLASMLLKGQAAAPRVLVANIHTNLLYWPLLQLAGAATEDMTLGVAVGSQGRGRTLGGASDVRAALLVLLIGKCSVHQSTYEEVGGEEFFRSLLDDMDARVAYYTASYLLKRMMSEEPEHYQRVLHTLVFRAQQCNNEKLLENPYLQMRGIMQLSNDPGGLTTIQET